VILEDFLQLFGETLGMEQVIDPQAAPGNLVLVGRADALAGRADLLVFGLDAFTRLVDRRVVRKDQRTSRTDLEPRTDVNTALFQFGNFR
jgi:hypothetical protein